MEGMVRVEEGGGEGRVGGGVAGKVDREGGGE